MTRLPNAARAAPRSTAFGVLAIWVPLFSGLLWWVFQNRVVTPWTYAPGTLPPWLAILSAAMVAGTAALLGALFLANHRRLKAVFRPSRGRVIATIALVVLAPFGSIAIIPILPYIPIFSILGGWAPLGFLAVFLAWYPVASLVVSGVRHRALRVAALLLVGWTGYFLSYLIAGFQPLVL